MGATKSAAEYSMGEFVDTNNALLNTDHESEGERNESSFCLLHQEGHVQMPFRRNGSVEIQIKIRVENYTHLSEEKDMSKDNFSNWDFQMNENYNYKQF